MAALYDRIAKVYSGTRQTDPRLEAALQAELTGASRILNIGAGTGSYEPTGVDLVALEPSSKMISQRKPDAHPPEGLQRLRDDLESGRWEERNRDILGLTAMDMGYRLVTAKIRR